MRGNYNTTVRVNWGPAFGGGVKANNVPARVVLADAVTPQGLSVGYRSWVTMPVTTPLRGAQDTPHGEFLVTRADRLFDLSVGTLIGVVLWSESWTWLTQPTYTRAYIDKSAAVIPTACCLAGIPTTLVMRIRDATSDPDLHNLVFAINYAGGMWSGSTVSPGGQLVTVSWFCGLLGWEGLFTVSSGVNQPMPASATPCGPLLSEWNAASPPLAALRFDLQTS